jgi:hypothetical protein
MIRDLYLNEELILSINKQNKLECLLLKDSIIQPVGIKGFETIVKERPSVMEQLRAGEKLDISTDGNNIVSTIKEDKGVGYSIPSSVEDLENKLNARRF